MSAIFARRNPKRVSVLGELGTVGPFGGSLSGIDWLSVLSGEDCFGDSLWGIDWLSVLSGRDGRERRAIGEIFADPGCLDRNGSRLRGARKGLGWSVYVPAFPLPRVFAMKIFFFFTCHKHF